MISYYAHVKESLLLSSEGKKASLIDTRTGKKDLLIAYEIKTDEWAEISKGTFDTILRANYKF